MTLVAATLLSLVAYALLTLLFAAWWYVYSRRAYRKARERDRRDE
jgi:hypothetical protein